jgi:hypothetical protein
VGVLLPLQYNRNADGQQRWAGLLDDPKLASLPSGDLEADLQLVLHIIQRKLPVDAPEE